MRKYIYLVLLTILAVFAFRNLFLNVKNDVHYFVNGALFGGALVLIILMFIYWKKLKK